MLLIVSGFAFAPAGAVLYTLIDEVAPPGTATEASTWMITAIVVGLAAGNAIAGALVSGGHPHRGYALAVRRGVRSLGDRLPGAPRAAARRAGDRDAPISERLFDSYNRLTMASAPIGSSSQELARTT